MTKRLRIEIPLVLPDVPDARDACVRRLGELLEAKKGVQAAHVLEASKETPQQLCIHFDPQQLSLGDVRELARRAGAQIHERYGHMLLRVEPTHVRRARAISLHLERANGLLEAAVSPDGIVRIEFDREKTNEATVRSFVRDAGVRLIEEKPPRIVKPKPEPQPPETAREEREVEHEHGAILGEKTELAFAALCGVFLLLGWLTSFFSYNGPRVLQWGPLALYVLAYGFGAFFTLREAIEKIRSGRFEIDFLMLLAAMGAAILGEWAEGALLLFLFSLGHALEHYAMGRARRAIEALAELAPEIALVRRNGHVQELPVEQLQRGDVVVVKPNERIPADGFVVKGETTVDQAPITGESVPVDKRPVDDPAKAAQEPDRLDPQHRVFAGTINQRGALEIQVTKKATETTLARVVEMVSEAETTASPTQRFTDKFERYFTPAVLALAGLLLFAWVVIDEPFRDSFYRAMAVLVAASPCALAIATPSAVLSGVARAARGGVLVKGGAPLEALGALGAIAFDKTGTLTEGKPRLTDVLIAEGASEAELLRVAIAVEQLSDHPLAAAVVRDGKVRLDAQALPEAHDLRSITGRGVTAQVENQPVHIGKDALFSEVEGPDLPASLREMVEKLKTDGRTTMIVRHGDRYLGALGLMDTPRASARVVVERLRELGVRRMVMLSGDNQRVADAVAKEIGIDEAWGDLMPEDKVTAIKKLRQEEDVAMVGDGVNDAPAMANATVGIAMGAAGSDVALETADVALMADDLNHLPFAVGLSRQTRRVIRQNLWMSLGMVAILIPATLLGLRIGAAVGLHEGSTLLVVANALRLLAYKPA